MTVLHGHDHPSSDQPSWRLLALILGGLLIVRVAALYFAKTNLFFDEAQYWAWSTDLSFGYFSKPPVLAWTIRASTQLCGLSEFCIRLPSPILHTGAAIFIFLAARALYGPRTGFWAAIVYATLPGLSYSAGIISTDVPLLFFWAAALFFFVMLLQTRAWAPAIALGLAIGFGLLSKYAMAYFILCALICCVLDRDARWLLTSAKSLAVLFIAALLIAPNIAWNIENGFVTFSHTAANAKWEGSLIHPLKALEFFAAQFGVFGPILFASLMIIVWRFFKGGLDKGLDKNDRLLLAFSVPVILLITTQALLSRAHANWAATAYPAAAILVTATIIRDDAWRWMRASLALHLAIVVLLAVALAGASRIDLPARIDPFKRVTAWDDIARATHARLGEGQYKAILTDGRALTSELLYYLRQSPVPILAWRPGKVPHDHFQLTRPFPNEKLQDPLLFATLRAQPEDVTANFETATLLGHYKVPTGATTSRTVYYYALSGFKAR